MHDEKMGTFWKARIEDVKERNLGPPFFFGICLVAGK